jgi:DNA ligase-1
MTVQKLALYLQKLEATSSRLEITQILADLFKQTTPQEIDKVAYLVLGRLAPAYKSIIFNVADQLVIASIAQAYKHEIADVKKLYKELGDLGDVAQRLAAKNNSAHFVSIKSFYEILVGIAKEEGNGSVERKIQGLSDILQILDPLSARYTVRIPLGRLRLGFSDKTMLDALSWMEYGDKSGKSKLDRAYQVLPDIGLLAREVREKGIDAATKQIKPKLGVPVMPMLAQRIKSTKEMIEKMGEVMVEPKYDGVRVCIHFKKGSKPRAFTRNLNDVSNMFPELESLEKYTSASSFILDAEAVGIDPQRKSLLDFQTTMQRRRKHNIGATATKIPLNFFIFDILAKDGDSFMEEPYQKRREILAKTIKDTGPFKLTPFTVTADPKVIRSLYDQYIATGLEGVLVKQSRSAYIPGRTGYRWVKMKQVEESSGKLSDTIDAVIMGFTSGQGKRVSFGVGQFLAGVIEGGKIKTLTKVGTGLSDEQFKELKTRLDKIITKDQPKEYELHKDLTPDYWVRPEVIVELAGDDLTVSPKHTSGYALRFPRLVRFRDDKSASQATTVKEVEKLYKLQKK